MNIKVRSINIEDVEVLTNLKGQITATFTAVFTVVPPPTIVTSINFRVLGANSYEALGLLPSPIDFFVRQDWNVGITGKSMKHL